jgi:two-component system sensor kinase FixL
MAATLFEPLATNKAQGLGLGLPISRTIVEAHGGRLWLDATARGARFCLTLPVAP